MAPQSHPRAQFVPIPPDLDLSALVENTSNFDYVTRLPNEMLKEHSQQSLEQLVLLHVVIGGKPLVIEGWGDNLDPYLFSPEWLQQNLGKKPEQVRDIPNEVNIPMTMGHYLRSMPQLTTQFTPSNYRDAKRQRLYLKDIDCPDEWARHLERLIPEIFYYLNDCIESRTGGDGAILEPNEYGQMGYGKGVAPAGDLMSSLPPEMRALNMMCYIGHEGTFTPAHREMCASLGHNVMVETSHDNRGEKPGSSIWFMTETKEREVVSEYFLSMLGHDIEVEKHFAQINAWKKAPFNVWVVEQKVGDLILIPPLAPHQVWNRGTRTVKAAWNRTTVDTLELAINEALPRARMVCREEQYKNKAIIYYTLIKYQEMVSRNTVEQKMWKYGRIRQLFEDFKRLFALYTDILVSEMFAAAQPESDVEFLEYESFVTCSYCRCNIWNRFLTCKTCVETGPGGEEDTYDVCMDCYVMGRSCRCISNLHWVEQWKWSDLTTNYETWRQTIIEYDGFFNVQTSPQPLEVARKRFGRKPVAQICQEQLKLRPWVDVKNPEAREPSVESEPDVDDEGRIVKNKKNARRSSGRKSRPVARKGKTKGCHICFHHHDIWKMACCTTCNLAYCYGTLWRAFDLMPQAVMEDRDWSCPKCLQMCSCGACRKRSDQTPYQPKGTLLGHDTKKVADFRSIESLVDFSKTNLGWLRGENDSDPKESDRMKKLKEKAEAEKNREDVIDENYLEGGDAQNNDAQDDNEDYPQFDMGNIDPELRDGTSSGNGVNHFEDAFNATTANTNGAEKVPANDDGDENYDWLEGHYDLEHIAAFNRGGASYPSQLLAPVAPVAPMQAPSPTAAPAQEEPEPEAEIPEAPAGQSRMMGIGYYQQRGGVDKIAYEPPTAETAENGPPDLTVAANNPNFALSDLLPKPVEEPAKKKRHRTDDEDDVDFFTSKKARVAAEAKRRSGGDSLAATGAKQKQPPAPRRVPKPQTYVDLGEESLPYTADDMVPALPKKERKEGDLEITTKAANHHKKPEGDKTKRRSTRQSDSTTPAPTQSKPPRKSAWLARREAEEAGEELPSSENPKRTRGRPKATATADISSNNEDEGGVSIEEDNSLFGDADAGGNSSEGSVIDVQDAKNKTLQVESEHEERVANPTPKKRGRPPKNRPSTKASMSSPPASEGPPRILSLKDKLAHKGNGFKIVAKKPRKSIDSPAATPIAKSTPSVVIGAAASPGSRGVDAEDSATQARNKADPIANKSLPEKPPNPPTAIGRSDSFETPRSESHRPRGPTVIRKDFSEAPEFGGTGISMGRPAVPPAKKGPTVVRLESPSDESDGSGIPAQREISSDDDSDGSIPAVQPGSKVSRGGGPVRGRGVSNGVGRGRGRGRGRPSLA